MQDQLSYEDIEKMRRLVQSADAQRQPMKTIDLNNPPREPYHFQSFPKMVYDLERSVPGHIVYRVVRHEAEFREAIEEGFSTDAPAFGDAPEVTLSPQYRAEAEHVQDQIEEQKAKRAYNRKAA